MKDMVLKVQDLFCGYGGVPVLQGVSLQVTEGEFIALIGSNGAGKSTLLRTVSGLLKPSRGSIMFCGNQIDGMLPHSIARMGLVHVPEGRQLWPRMSVQDTLLLGAYQSRAKAVRKTTLRQVYDLFPRLEERNRQLAGTLSGGEQQMLAIGRALMSCPILLMLDEPSLGLAPLVVDQVYQAIRQIRQSGVSIFMVEQDVSQVLTHADRAYVLENGVIVLEGAGQILLEDRRVQSSYLPQIESRQAANLEACGAEVVPLSRVLFKL